MHGEAGEAGAILLIFDIEGENEDLCGKRSVFTELDESVNDQVTFGVSWKIPIKVKQNIYIRQRYKGRQFVSNLYYSPDTKIDILNMG